MTYNHGSSSSSSSTLKAALLDNEENSKQKEPVTVYDGDSSVAKEMKLHVLIVDADPVTRFNLEFLFLNHDCNVSTAETCEEALRLLRIDHNGVIDMTKQETIPPIDLIIVDYFMEGAPGLAGYMLLPILKKSPMEEIQVVVLVPQRPLTEAQINRCMEDGAYFFVTKPLSDPVEVERFKSIVKIYTSLKKKAGMISDPLNANLIMAKSTEDDSDTDPLNANLIKAKATLDDPDTDPFNANLIMAKETGDDPDTDPLNENLIMAKSTGDDP